MSCEQLTRWLPDYWAGTLPDDERRAFDTHLASCAACRSEVQGLTRTWHALGALATEEPSPVLRRRFDAMLDGWRAEPSRLNAGVHNLPSRLSPKVSDGWWRPVWQLAAAALCVAIGFAAGRVWPGGPSGGELSELRHELRDMRQMVMLTLLQQQSASERLRGVTWSYQLDRPSGEVLSALLDRLVDDPNVNVRLASIDALEPFVDDTRVRNGLVDALASDQQQSPLVQVALIDTLVRLHEPRSLDLMHLLAKDARVNDTVRRRAAWAIEKLKARGGT